MSHRICGRWYVPFLLLCVFALYAISYADVTPVADRTAQVRDKIVAVVPGVDSAADVTAEHLSTIRSLNLRLLKITTLASGDFSGLTGLTSLNLYGNQLSSLPDGIFEGLTSLTSLRLGRNTVDPLPLTVSLEKVAEGEFKAVVPAGATFDVVLPITVANGSITSGATDLTISQGNTESSLFVVTRTPGTIGKVTVDIGTLPSLPRNHYGYTFTKSGTLPLTVIAGINTDPVVKVPDVQEVVPVETPNTAPTFAEGDSTTRAVAENVSAGTNIGAPITATDAKDDTLTWTLGGVDAAAFAIDSTTGQLKTKAPLDYETKRVYSVTLTVADEALSDTITVIISVIDVSDTVFAAGVFPVVERTPQVRDAILEAIPTVHDATQVTATHLASITALNLRNKGISALKTGDFSGLVALTDLNLYGNQLSSLPVGTFDGLGALTTLRLSGNVVDPLPLIVSLQQVRDNVYRAIIPTGAPFPIRLPITVTDGSVSGRITSVVIPQGSRHSAAFTVVGTSAKVSIGMLPRLPRNHFGYVLAQSTVSSRTEQVAIAIAAAVSARAISTVTEIDLATITGLDLSGTSLTTLKTGDFADMVSLTTLNLSNNALTNLPVGIFDDAPSLRSITLANNQLSSLPAGLFTGLSFLSTVDLSGNGITSLSGDTFSGLSALTTLNLSNNKLSTLPTGIFDGLTSLNQLSLSGNVVDPLQIGVSLQKVGTNQFKAVASTGAPFNIVLPLEQIYGTVRGGVKTIQIPKGSVESQSLTMVRIPNTIAAVTVDIVNVPHLPSNHNGYALVKSMTRRLEVLPKLNSSPVFTEGTSTTRTVSENTDSHTNIGTPVSATDADEDTLTYRIGGTDANTFSLNSTNGQLRTSAALDYENKNSYSVTVSVSDGNGGTDSITVTINVTDVVEITVIEEDEPEDSAQQETTINTPPMFTDGTSTTRSIAENTGSGVDIGSAVSATDADSGDTLTYTLGGTDVNAFSINSTNGQLRTSAALDYENKNSYSVTVSVSDGNGGTDSITVTINVTDVNENRAPVFSEGTSTTRSVAENTGSGVNIGTAVSATDADNDALTYTLGGTDENAFSINSTNGQLRTSAALDYENKNSYSITVSVSDGNGGTDSITVTINVTDVVEITVIEEDEPEDSAQQETTTNTPPVFTDGTSTTRSIAENTGSGVDIGSAVSATDADSGDTLTYTLGGTDVNAFSINSTNGQLRTSAALDYENKNSYSVTVSVSDGNGGTDSITVTINVTDVNENRAPVFTEGTSTTRSVAENTGSGVNIGTTVSATDADNDTLTYTLGGTDAASFSIDRSSGQLQTKASLDYESKTSYTVTVTVSDGTLTSTITVVINVSDIDETTQQNNLREDVWMPDVHLRFAVRTALDIGSEALTQTKMLELTSLTAQNAFISNLKGLEYAKNLTHLDVASNSITSISVLQSLTKLVHLNIEYNQVTDIGVLTDLTALQYIYVAGNPLTDLSPISNRPLAGLSWPAVEPKEPSPNVNIFDANLAAAIRKTLGLENDASITETDMERLTSLTATNAQISSLSGLKYATNLTTLDVSNNEIWSVSPITGLRRLTSLNLSQNQISSVYGLHWIESLRVLKLAGNSIDIKDAAPLLLLENLSEVDIKLPTQVNVPDRALAKILRSKLSITSKIPITQEALQTITSLANDYISEGYRQGADEIEDLTGLEHATAMTSLSLPYHGVSNITALQSLTQLTSLDFSNNYELSNYTPLSGLTNLTSLNLVNTYISDISALSGLTKLTDLNIGEDFYGSPFRESELSNISPLTNLTELTSLTFSKTEVSDISHLSGLTKLTTLRISDTEVSDISHISGLTNLTTLDISRTKVSNISTLSNLTKLESLYLSGNRIADISPLTGLTNLGYLTLNGNPIVNTLPLCPLLRSNGGNLFYVDIEVLNCPPQTNNAPVSTEVDSTTGTVAENTAHTAVPKSTSLLSNFPNPFNPETWIPYQLANPSEVTITIFDVRGRVVRTLILGTQPAGFYRSQSKAAHWDGKNTFGEKVAGGLYFYRLTAGDFSATRKMLILK